MPLSVDGGQVIEVCFMGNTALSLKEIRHMASRLGVR